MILRSMDLIMHHPRYQFIVTVALSALVMSCATDVANRYYAAEKYPAKDPREVELLFSRPKREFVVIADFQSRGDTGESMRRRAAEIGADAVIVTTLGGQYSFSDEWVNNDSMQNTSSRIIGTALRYK